MCVDVKTLLYAFIVAKNKYQPRKKEHIMNITIVSLKS